MKIRSEREHKICTRISRYLKDKEKTYLYNSVVSLTSHNTSDCIADYHGFHLGQQEVSCEITFIFLKYLHYCYIHLT
jgi:hypothetical protein